MSDKRDGIKCINLCDQNLMYSWGEAEVYVQCTSRVKNYFHDAKNPFMSATSWEMSAKISDLSAIFICPTQAEMVQVL